MYLSVYFVIILTNIYITLTMSQTVFNCFININLFNPGKNYISFHYYPHFANDENKAQGC